MSFIFSFNFYCCQVDSLHVHGVAIPTFDGIRNVLKHIGAQKKGNRAQVLWINLREEPVYLFFSDHNISLAYKHATLML